MAGLAQAEMSAMIGSGRAVWPHWRAGSMRRWWQCAGGWWPTVCARCRAHSSLARAGLHSFIYSIMGLALGFGLGAGAFRHGYRAATLQLLSALFWTVFLVWQVLPIALASFQEQFDLNGLLRFPVSFGSFYLLQRGLRACGCADDPWRNLQPRNPGRRDAGAAGLFGWTALVLAVVRALQYSAGADGAGLGRSLAGEAQDA